MVYGKSVDLFLGRIVPNEGSVWYKSNARGGVPRVSQKSELSRFPPDNMCNEILKLSETFKGSGYSFEGMMTREE